MLRKTTAALFAAALGFMPQIAGAQDQAQGATTLKATNGAWEVRCSTAKPDACIMTQVGNREDGKPVLRVALRKTDGAKGPNGAPIAAVIQIDAPVGVLLPAGIEMKIDGREIGRAAFQVCDARACIASEPVPTDFVNQMKNGVKAVLSIMAVNGEKADVPISLSGFTKSFDSL
ncbi:invasion associated locus B family protein [Pikeienuella sp. HZG-20]|uniref:invasion associated locus B family protein n=1 Tax=Paludibacillus litoralis TaxID=3133267 RepID=UPI0030EF60F2